MQGFEELQAIWQSQPSPAHAVQLDALRDSLHDYGGRMKRIYAVKFAAIAILSSAVLLFGRLSPTLLAAVVAVISVAVIMLALDWRKQRAIARVDFTTVPVAFVRDTINRLREQREPFRRSYRLIFAVVALFENLWVASLPVHWTWPVRGACHLLATALPWGVLELGRYVRVRRFERECRPILDRLTAIEQSLREGA
jgi:hypothetical protein